jgi:hypothetical protein
MENKLEDKNFYSVIAINDLFKFIKNIKSCNKYLIDENVLFKGTTMNMNCIVTINDDDVTCLMLKGNLIYDIKSKIKKVTEKRYHRIYSIDYIDIDLLHKIIKNKMNKEGKNKKILIKLGISDKIEFYDYDKVMNDTTKTLRSSRICFIRSNEIGISDKWVNFDSYFLPYSNGKTSEFSINRQKFMNILKNIKTDEIMFSRKEMLVNLSGFNKNSFNFDSNENELTSTCVYGLYDSNYKMKRQLQLNIKVNGNYKIENENLLFYTSFEIKYLLKILKNVNTEMVNIILSDCDSIMIVSDNNKIQQRFKLSCLSTTRYPVVLFD